MNSAKMLHVRLEPKVGTLIEVLTRLKNIKSKLAQNSMQILAIERKLEKEIQSRIHLHNCANL